MFNVVRVVRVSNFNQNSFNLFFRVRPRSWYLVAFAFHGRNKIDAALGSAIHEEVREKGHRLREGSAKEGDGDLECSSDIFIWESFVGRHRCVSQLLDMMAR